MRHKFNLHKSYRNGYDVSDDINMYDGAFNTILSDQIQKYFLFKNFAAEE